MQKKIIVTVAQDFIVHSITRSLYQGLKKLGHELKVVTFKESDKAKIESYNENIDVYVFKAHYRWLPRSIRGLFLAPILDSFIKKICGRDPNLVISNLLPADRILAHSKLNTFFVIHNTMSQEISDLGLNLEKISKIYSKKPTIGVSKGVRDDFIKLFSNYPIREAHYIYNPMNMNLIKSLGNRRIEISDNYIVHVGKLTNQKRHDILFRAYEKSGVKEKLILLGKGELEHDLKALAKDLKIEKKVIFAGFIKNPYPYIKNAKLMVLSSIYEGLPTVILESIILDTPVISTDCPSGPSEMLPSKNLTPMNDIEKLAEKIKSACQSPEKYHVKLDPIFYLENVVKQYLNLSK